MTWARTAEAASSSSEWIEGANLATRIKDDRPAHREAARIVAEVADALGHAHAHGLRPPGHQARQHPAGPLRAGRT